MRSRDLPFFLVAAFFHALLLAANPSIQWGSSNPIPEKTIAVDFVSAPPSPALAPVPAGEGHGDAIAAHGAGAYVPEKVKKSRIHKKKAISPAARAARSKARAERRQRQAAARAARAEIAAIKASEAKRQAAIITQERHDRAVRVAQEKAARTRKKAELSRELASLSNPDEALAAAEPEAPAPAGKAARFSAKFSGKDDPVFDLDGDGRDALNAKASGGGPKTDGGDVSWSIEGPIGSRRLLARKLPVSPDWVSQRGLELRVAVKFQVLDNGMVKAGAVIKRSSGFPEIDHRALEALKHWKFESIPARSSGPETWGSVTFRFTMG